MPAYMIARIEVSDPDEYMRYASQTAALAEKHGGRFLVKGGRMLQLEGHGSDRHIVIEFDDFAAAEAFYHAPDYQRILPIALASSRRDLIIVEGV